jgi:hypothetical protein
MDSLALQGPIPEREEVEIRLSCAAMEHEKVGPVAQKQACSIC